VTALVESDLRTAFGRRHVDLRAAKREARDVPRRALLLTLATTTDTLAHITLTLEAEGETVLSRRLDLGRFPADGRVLALVVTADELLQVSREPARAAAPVDPPAPRAAASLSVGPSVAPPRAGPRPPAPVPASPPAPAPVAPTAPVAVTPPPAAPPPAASIAAPIMDPVADPAAAAALPPRAPAAPGAPTIERGAADVAGGARVGAATAASTLAATFAFDSYGGGQSQLGPEITWRGRLGGRACASIAVAGRQGLATSAPLGTVTSRLFGGRLALGAGFAPGDGRFALAVDAGVRGAGLWYEGHAATGARGHAVGAFIAYADVVAALDLRIASRAALRASVGGGVPLVAARVMDTTGGLTGASGWLAEAQLGAVLVF
jgi:hypothetical protein